MSAWWPLLRDGLRLSLLRAPREVPRKVSPWPALAFALLSFLLILPSEWLLAQPPRSVETAGARTFLIDFALTLLAAHVLVALTQRRRLWTTVAAWLAAASILPALVLFIATWWATGVDESAVLSALAFLGSYIAIALWGFAIFLRLALFLASGEHGRAVAAAVLAFLLATVPWLIATPENFIVGSDEALTGDADYDFDEEDISFDEEIFDAYLKDPETTIYAQSALLDAELAKLAPQRAGMPEMFVIGFGGDAEENVFRNEVEFLRELSTQRLDAENHQLSLLNNTATQTQWPLASATNLERALKGMAQRMDVEEDILFLYLTSHGSEDHELYVNQPPLPLDQLTPGRLRTALDAAKIRWRVIVISACYSGGFANALRDPHTLVVTASRHDRTSFGCGNTSTITWFGQSFLVDGLNASRNFRSAFLSTRRQIAEREEAEGFDPSEPQWAAGERIGDKLKAWQKGLSDSSPIAFAPVWIPPQEADALPAADSEMTDSEMVDPEMVDPEMTDPEPADAQTDEFQKSEISE